MIARATALLLLLGAVAAGPAASQTAVSAEAQIKAAVHHIYARYRRAPLAPSPADDRALYSSRTADLIARWHAGQPDDDVTTMGDFDWFCQCQDYDEKSFAITSLRVRKRGAGFFDAQVAYHLGWGSRAGLTLVMVREGSGWKVDDIRFARDAATKTLRADLAAEIGQFEKRRPSRPGE
ncbi:hypothetical protein FHS91_003140 [Sphingobium xanthum]|uniref:DUF3828 domain-containing protein n=1 Tax=Sphingobium xanthum TaxID=1387165 RepID=UPI001C8C386F|nr:DUF3828 domain-containing protein [Sphingobium xanthum]